MRYAGLALALLAVSLGGSYAWRWAPEAAQGDVDRIGTHCIVLALLVVVHAAYRSRALLPVLVLQAAYSVQAAGCSALYLVSPWQVLPGDEQCSAGVGLPLGAAGLVAGLLVLAHLLRRRRDGRCTNP